MKELPDAIAAAAGSLGEAHIEALVEAYRPAGPFTTAHAAKARQAVPAPHHGAVDRLNLAWAAEPNMAGDSIAVALESVQSAQRLADTPIVEVVVTGPDSPAAPVRLTSEVVRQLIDQATQGVTLVSYAAYQLPAVITALDDAVARGVQVPHPRVTGEARGRGRRGRLRQVPDLPQAHRPPGPPEGEASRQGRDHRQPRRATHQRQHDKRGL